MTSVSFALPGFITDHCVGHESEVVGVGLSDAKAPLSANAVDTFATLFTTAVSAVCR